MRHLRGQKHFKVRESANGNRWLMGLTGICHAGILLKECEQQPNLPHPGSVKQMAAREKQVPVSRIITRCSLGALL